MKRKDVLKELLNAVFGSTTVKPTGDKIYRSGDLFSSCEFSTNDYNSYLRLLRIAFINNNPQIQRPNYGRKILIEMKVYLIFSIILETMMNI